MTDEGKIKNRGEWLREIVAPMSCKRGIELGTHLAGFAESILKDGNVAHLHCVDPWTGQFYKSQDPEERYNKAIIRLWKYKDRVTVMRDTSLNVAGQFETGEFDFVYLDALHRYEYPDGSGCNADILTYWDKVASGGIFAGHDYYSRHECGVVRAVTEFEERTGLKVQVTTGDRHPTWWVIKP